MPKAVLDPKNVLTLAGPKPGKKLIEWYDEGPYAVPWFVLRIDQAGRRRFVLGYRIGRDRRRKQLGPPIAPTRLDPGISLGQARTEAKAILKLVGAGRDPVKEEREARAPALSVAGLVERYIAAKESDLADATKIEYRRMVKADLTGSFGRTPAPDVQVADAAEFFATKKPAMANRLFQLLRAAFRWAPRRGQLLPSNPLEFMTRPRKEKPRDRVLRDHEVKALLLAIGSDKETGRPYVRPEVAAVVRVLLLLGQRSSETVEMRWRDLDLDPEAGLTPQDQARAKVRTWTIPGDFRKNGRTHTIPIPEPVAVLLKALPRTGERVFPSVSEANAERDWWGDIRDRAMALVTESQSHEAERFAKHDLRRTCATNLGDLGFPLPIVSRILGHAAIEGTSQVTRIYDRSAMLKPALAALDAWAARVDELEALASLDAAREYQERKRERYAEAGISEEKWN